jgi:hypothetical protein
MTDHASDGLSHQGADATIAFETPMRAPAHLAILTLLVTFDPPPGKQ